MADKDKAPLDPIAVVGELTFLLRQVERAAVGADTLQRAADGETAPPIMKFTGRAADADGVPRQVEILSDLTRPAFDKNYLRHVLAPQANAFVVELLQQLEKLVAAAGAWLRELQAQTQTPPAESTAKAGK